MRIPPLPPCMGRLSLKAQLERENFLNTMEVLSDIRREDTREFWRNMGGSGALNRAQVSLTGFMEANPNSQIAFAAAEGLIPDPELA